MHFLVIYDVTNDAERSRIVRVLKSVGLSRIQFSAFEGELDYNDKIVLEKRLAKFLKDETDSIYIIPLCERCRSVSTILSKRGESPDARPRDLKTDEKKISIV